MTTGYPILSTLACLSTLFGTIFALFNIKILLKLQTWLEPTPKKALLFPTGLFVVYVFYALRTGGFELASGLRMFAYVFVPVFLSVFLKARKIEHLAWRVLIFLLVVLPQDFGWIGVRQYGMRHALDWYIRALSGIILALVIGGGLGLFPEMKLGYKLSKVDIRWTIGLLFALIVLAGVAGIDSGFLTLRQFLNQPTVGGVIWQVLIHLFSARFFVTLLVYTISIALFEEIWFRGVLQPGLSFWCGNKVYGYVLTSLLFGAYHLNNNASGLHPTQWNWEYAVMAAMAGFVYGYAFKKTSRLWCSILLHGATDSIWHTFAT